MFALGLVLAFRPTLFSGLQKVQLDPADTRVINHTLETEHRWVFDGGPLLSPDFFSPQLNVAAYTDLLLGVLPLYSPWRLLGIAPDTSLQLWMLSVALLNYLGALLLLRRGLSLPWVASAFGAFVFAFGSPRLNQLGHQQLAAWFFATVAAYALCRIFTIGVSGRRVALFWSGAVAQLYAGVYSGWFFGFGVALLLTVALARPMTRAQVLAAMREAKWAWAIGAVVSLAVLAPLAIAYLGAAHTLGLRSFGEAAGMVPRVQSWLYVGPDNLLYGRLASLGMFTGLPMEWEHRLGIGPLSTVVVVWTMWKYRAMPAVRVLAIASVSVIVLATMYKFRVTPWFVIFKVVPGAGALRAVSRIGLLMLFPAAIAIGLFVQRVKRGWVVAAFCLLEQVQQPGSYDKQSLRDEVAAVAAAVPRECSSFFYAQRGDAFGLETAQLNAMWARLEVGKPTVNGYSGAIPPGWELRDNVIHAPEDETRLRSALDRWAALNHLTEPPCFVVR